jgi:hypothetical protein
VKKIDPAQCQEPISIFFPDQEEWRLLRVEGGKSFIKAERIESNPVNLFLCEDSGGRGGGENISR